MAIITGAFSACAESDIDYPDSDGRPVAETPIHRDNLFGMVFQLQRWFADDPMVYVSGNMFVYYEQGQPSKTVAPDVFVVIGVPRDKPRRSYKVWEEDGHAPDLVIEVTSRSTKTEDQRDKFALYRDTLLVREYFLFDPYAEYLKPALRGYRLLAGEYEPIDAVVGRLPSEVTGLHLEQTGRELRLWNPTVGSWLPNFADIYALDDRLHAEVAQLQTDSLRFQTEAQHFQTEAQRLASKAGEAEAENQRLRAELEALKRKRAGGDQEA
jgi:Uma2 family endonuclease